MTRNLKTLFNDWKNKNKDKIEDVVITLLNYEKGVDTKLAMTKWMGIENG